MTAQNRAHWIQTYRGQPFDLLDLDSGQIHLEDLSMALSQLNRLGGHTEYPYSVAQHSLLVAQLLFDANQPNIVILQGLLYAAPEAYLGDVSPTLQALLPEYAVIERRVWNAVCERFDLDLALHAAVVLAADLAMRAEAWELLRANPVRHWAGTKPRLSQAAQAVLIRPMSSWEARRAWQQAVTRRLGCRRTA